MGPLADLPFPQPLLALWRDHPGDILGEPIQFVTRGQWSHAGWLRQDHATIWENYFPKIRNRPLKTGESKLIDLFVLDGMTPYLAEKFERYFDITTQVDGLAEHYSVGGLFGWLLNVPPATEQNLMCSATDMQSIRKIAPALLPLARCEDWQVSPVDLGRSPRLIPVDW